MTIVKRATEDDWRQVRLVRLSALADSPSAFGSSHEEEQRFSENDWREWALSGPVFIAFANRAPVGMVAAINEDSPEERRLVALWVHPDHRRSGVASALVSHVESWARHDGAERLTLWVTRRNESARHLYQALNFRHSEKRKPLPSEPGIDEEQMLLFLH